MIRSFIAIDLPQDHREQLGRLVNDLNRLGLDGRAARPEGIHLTLKFLGSVPEPTLPLIRRALEELAREFKCFALRIAGMGVFPDLVRPRVIWAGVERNPELTRLQDAVENEMVEFGFEKEKRAFHPHLTLMRLKSSKNHKRLLDFLAQERTKLDLPFFPVESFVLYRSDLKPTGAEYRPQAVFRLQGEPDSQEEIPDNGRLGRTG